MKANAMNEGEGVCLKRVRACGSDMKISALRDYQKIIATNTEYQENKRIEKNILVLLTASPFTHTHTHTRILLFI